MAGVRVGEWAPLGRQSEARMTRHDIVCLHTMVGSLAGTDRMFRAQGYAGTESHWGVGGYGDTRQWQDTDYVADAQLEGNGRCLSVETADWGDDRDGEPFTRWDTRNAALVPAWTAAQMEAIARILVACHRQYHIPLAIIPDSLPGRRGVGYHRLGCDPWRVPGGESWSKAVGKVCPGARRIAQIPFVVDLARRMVAGRPLPDPPPTPPPPELLEDPMHAIALTFYDDHDNPDPAGPVFRGAAPVEQGPSGGGQARTWVRWVNPGAAGQWRIEFWGSEGRLGDVPDPHTRDYAEAPKGCRAVSIWGRRASPVDTPAASLVTQVVL